MNCLLLNSTDNFMAAIGVIFPVKPELRYYLQDALLKTVYGLAVDQDMLLPAGREAKSFVSVDL